MSKNAQCASASQPLRMIGEHTVNVRLTVDLIPEIKVIVHREGESIAAALEEAEMLAEESAELVDLDLDESVSTDSVDIEDVEDGVEEPEPEAQGE